MSLVRVFNLGDFRDHDHGLPLEDLAVVLKQTHIHRLRPLTRVVLATTATTRVN